MKSTHLHAAPFTAALLATLFVALPGRADESEMFAQRQKAIQAQLEDFPFRVFLHRQGLAASLQW